MNENLLSYLLKKSKIYRRKILDLSYKSGKGHIGGAYSILDVLVYMYHSSLRSKFPNSIFLVGKGHVYLASSVIWADLNIIDPLLLETFTENDTLLGGQFTTSIPESIYNSGSLGHVIGISSGYALALKLLKDKTKLVFSIIGDGECEEGSIWESMDFAVRNELDNLIVIVDRNGLSITDFIPNDRLVEKFTAFGANCIEIDGHDFNSIENAFTKALESTKKVTVLVANTIKGKGVSIFENNAKWHAGLVSEDVYNKAKKELI